MGGGCTPSAPTRMPPAIAGFPSQRIVFLAFVLCGALAGLAGFMFLARFGNITVVAGLGIELASVAAVVVGGVSNAGGIGTAVGALLGAILIDLLDNSLIRWLEISEFWRDALLGLLILLAVAADTVIMNRLRNLWARRSELQMNQTAVNSRLRKEAAMSPNQGFLSGLWERLKSWEGFLLVLLLIIIAINSVQAPAYLSIGNQINLFQLSIEKIIVALVMTFIIINAEIDLSVASMMGLVGLRAGLVSRAGRADSDGPSAEPGRSACWAAPSTASGSPSSACPPWW